MLTLFEQMRRRAVSQERLERSTPLSSSSHLEDDDRPSSYAAKTMPTPRMTPRNKQASSCELISTCGMNKLLFKGTVTQDFRPSVWGFVSSVSFYFIQNVGRKIVKTETSSFSEILYLSVTHIYYW